MVYQSVNSYLSGCFWSVTDLDLGLLRKWSLIRSGKFSQNFSLHITLFSYGMSYVLNSEVTSEDCLAPALCNEID